MKKLEKEKRAYDYFKRSIGKTFDCQMLSKETGWSIATVKTYISKKWYHFLESSGNGYRVKSFAYDSFSDFRKLQTQIYEIVDPGQDKKTFDYDVALSFAGEDRAFVDEIASFLKEFGINIFYDKYLTSDLWGKNLYVHLDDVYQNKSKYCVIFISRHYKEKLWTNHERESAQARAFKNKEEYILPVRLDDTVIPGLRETTAYIDGRIQKPADIGVLILEKLNKRDELHEMIETLKKELSANYVLTIKGSYLNFKNDKEKYEADLPIGMLMEMYKHGLLIQIIVAAAIVP